MSTRALVTGGSAGLGRAFCEALSDNGWSVLAVDRHEASDLPSVDHLTYDLADPEAPANLLETLAAAGECFDLVIFNAGTSATGQFEKLPLDAQLKVLRLNAEAPMILAAGLVREGMMKSSSRMLFIGSLSTFTGYPGAAAYAASKDALAVYARSIRKPFARLGIQVTCAFPGPLRTTHAERFAPEGADPSKRMAPERAASEILKRLFNGRTAITIGGGNRLAAMAGRLFPRASAFAMRQTIYRKLHRERW